MKAWRTVGFVGKPTTDGRELRGTVTVRRLPVPLMQVPRGRRGQGHAGAEVLGPVDVRVEGDEIQALLAWRHRRANLDLRCDQIDHLPTNWDPETGGPLLMLLHDPVVLGLTLSGRSVWPELW